MKGKAPPYIILHMRIMNRQQKKMTKFLYNLQQQKNTYFLTNDT